MTAERNFFTGMTLVMAAVVALGFARTFYLQGFFPGVQALAAPEPFYSLHGAVFSSWMALLVAQAILVRRGNIAWHRTLGLLGVVIAAGVVALGVYAVLVAAQRDGGFIGVPVPPRQFMLVPLTDMVLFGLFAALAIGYRKHPQAHKRLILLATTNLLEAAIVRLPVAVISAGVPVTTYALVDGFIVAIAVWDLRSGGRLHPATLWGGLLIILSQPLRIVLSGTDAWLAIGNSLF